MYGFPSDVDPKVFVGRTLETVTFAVNVIHLDLGPECSITVLGEVSYRVEQGGAPSSDVLPVLRTSLPALVGRDVEGAEIDGAGALRLNFEAGGVLWIPDDASPYESYSFTTPAGDFYV